MINKLGITEYKLRSIEKEIVKLKLQLLDYCFTFNNNKYNLKYLINLHEFIFSGFYFKDDLGTRDLDSIEKEAIEEYLRKITNICINEPENIENILSLIEKIWYLQPFIVGNTRTLLAFIKVLNDAFILNLNVDIEQDIKSSPKMFSINNFVNQKRLTKNK